VFSITKNTLDIILPNNKKLKNPVERRDFFEAFATFFLFLRVILLKGGF
jgi:hypothetical protein